MLGKWRVRETGGGKEMQDATVPFPQFPKKNPGVSKFRYLVRRLSFEHRNPGQSSDVV
jgi:hypothetical protein